MTSHEPDDALQDYVDGRLSESARAALERRLADDPELRRRLEDYRAIRGALRDDPAELPPGFYARARARFEEAHPIRRPWFRPLSWESLGVAAAALVVAALFLPQWIARSGPAVREPGDYRQAPRSAFDPDAVEESSGTGADDAAAETERQETGDVQQKNEAPAEERVREDLAVKKRVGAKPQPATVGEEDAADVLRDRAEAEGASEPPASAPAPAPAPIAERRIAPSKRSVGYVTASPRGIPLPGGLADPGTVRVIDGAEEWSALLATTEGRALAVLAPNWKHERVALLGARGLPVDCAEVRVVTGPRLRLVLTRGTDPATAETGCAIRLPAGDEPVVVEGP